MSRKTLTNTQRILDNWEDELTDIVYHYGNNLGIQHRELKKFIEELLEAKADQDYWIYAMN